MSGLERIGPDITAEIVRVMVLAGVAEAYGFTPHDDYGRDDEAATTSEEDN